MVTGLSLHLNFAAVPQALLLPFWSQSTKANRRVPGCKQIALSWRSTSTVFLFLNFLLGRTIVGLSPRRQVSLQETNPNIHMRNYLAPTCIYQTHIGRLLPNPLLQSLTRITSQSVVALLQGAHQPMIVSRLLHGSSNTSTAAAPT